MVATSGTMVNKVIYFYIQQKTSSPGRFRLSIDSLFTVLLFLSTPTPREHSHFHLIYLFSLYTTSPRLLSPTTRLVHHIFWKKRNNLRAHCNLNNRVFFSCSKKCVSFALLVLLLLLLSDCLWGFACFIWPVTPTWGSNHALCKVLINVTATQTVKGHSRIQASAMSGCSPLYYLWAQGWAHVEVSCNVFTLLLLDCSGDLGNISTRSTQRCWSNFQLGGSVMKALQCR